VNLCKVKTFKHNTAVGGQNLYENDRKTIL